MNSHNFYLNSNSDRKKLGKIKFGYVKGGKQNLANRIGDSREQFSDHSVFTHIFTFVKTGDYRLYKEIDKIVSLAGRDPEKITHVETSYGIKLPYLRKTGQYLVDGTNTNNEFIWTDGIELLKWVLEVEFPKLGLKLKKTYNAEEIEEINTMGREKREREKVERDNDLMNLHKLTRKSKHWVEREYQTDIIEKGMNRLETSNKFYLELATGGGKSYIVYRLLHRLQPNTIVIFAPRKKINTQNGDSKYISLLGDRYPVYNTSNEDNEYSLGDWLDRHTDTKKLIIACTQSHEKVYHDLHDKDIGGITVWFDEAHWGVEKKWVDDLDNVSKNFFLRNTNRITKRIFTSASPGKEVKQHVDIFGEVHAPIKVFELTRLKWLCPIHPRVLEYDKDSLDLSDWILEEFTRLNRQFGFSCHNSNNNAFELFYRHYQSFKRNETTIKPYLLIDNDKKGLTESNKNKLKEVNLDYKFRDVKNFEKHNNSLGYVCRMYVLGYDFPSLDCIVFSDPKVSFQDIIQCIGRIIRSDGLGERGMNRDKVSTVFLPVYIGGEGDETKYKNIIEVLRYLVIDLKLEEELFDQIVLSSTGGSNDNHKEINYSGKNNSSVLFDLLYRKNILKKPTLKVLYQVCRKHKITTEAEYNAFKDLNPSIPLKMCIYEYNGFKWKNVLDPDGVKYYGNQSEIDKAQDEILKKIEDEDELDELEDSFMNWEKWSQYDPKIPPITSGAAGNYYSRSLMC